MEVLKLDISRFERLYSFPRPTPLEELPNLRKAVGCKPRIFVKRDDTTTVGLGGNKIRKLDFVMAEAKRVNADVIITTAGVQSNHCRQTLALARKLGMECHLVLTGEEPAVRQGNLLLFTIMGAHLHFIGEEGSPSEKMEQIADELSVNGRRPFVIPIGASTPLGALGYIESVMEVREQSRQLGVEFGYAFLASGSSGTQAGAIIGAREFYPALKIHGISVGRDTETQSANIASLVNESYKFLGMDKSIDVSTVIVHDKYFGEKYGVATPECIEAIKLLGRTEGIVLDPVYTGKAMAGMLDIIRRNLVDDAEAVLFFHTGGSPAVFAMAEHFQK